MAGTIENPFLVATFADLQKVGTGTDGWTRSAHYKQVADIDCTSAFTPIGTSAQPFNGSYDGNGRIIRDLQIVRHAALINGLFGQLDGSVRDLSISNADVKANFYSAILAGIAKNATIERVRVDGDVLLYGDFAGLLVGYSDGATIQDSFAFGSVNYSLSGDPAGNDMGGFVGRVSDSTVRRCYLVGTVANTYNDPKPFIGSFSGTNTTTNNHYDADIAGRNDTDSGADPRATAQMKTASTFTGWDLPGVWYIKTFVNDGYPHLAFETIKAIFGELQEEQSTQGSLQGESSATGGISGEQETSGTLAAERATSGALQGDIETTGQTADDAESSGNLPEVYDE